MSTPRFDVYGDPLPPFALWRLGTVRWRHRGSSIDDLAFSRDGRTVFAAGIGFTAIDAATGTVRWSNPDVNATMFALLPAPDGDRLVAIGSGRIVSVLDAATGVLLRTSMLPTHSFNAVAVSPDGATVFVGGSQQFNALLAADGSTRAVLPISADVYVHLNGATFSPDGRALATTGIPGGVVLWSVADGRLLRALGPDDLCPNGASFTPDGRRLVVATDRGAFVVFDVATGDTVSTWQAHPTSVWRVAVTADGLRAVAIGADGTLSLWRLSDGARLAVRPSLERGFALALSPDGATVAHADGPRVALIDLATFAERAPSDEHSDAPQELVVARDGASVATARGPGAVRWWSLADGRLLASEALDRSLYALRPLPGGDRYVVMPPRDDGAVVIDMAARSLRVEAGIADKPLRWSGRAAVATPLGGKLTLTNAQGASRAFKARPDALAITSDDRYAVGIERGKVTIWDVENLAVAATAKVRAAVNVSAVALSTRGDEVAVCTKSGLQRLGVPDGVARAAWKAPSGARAMWAAYSSDGRRIAVRTYGSDVWIVDVASNQEVACVRGHGADVLAVVFDRDGERLITTSWDTTALVWSVAEAMAGHAQAAAPKGRRG